MKRTFGLTLSILLGTVSAATAHPRPVVRTVARGGGTGFGRAVAIAGDYAFVGEPSLNGGESGPVAGVVHIYRRGPTGWKEIDKLVAPNSLAGDSYGTALAADGATLVVARTPALASDSGHGSVYLYHRSAAGKWELAGRPIEGDRGAQFGNAIAVSGDLLLIGAPGEAAGGSVRIYRRAGDGSWSAAGSLPAQGVVANDRFGWSIAVDGDRVAVGAPGRQGRGAVFVFHRAADGAWNQETEQIAARNAPERAGLGTAVAVKGDRVAAGAPMANFGVAQAPLAPPGTILTQDQIRAAQVAQAARGPLGQFGSGMVVVLSLIHI